MANKEITIIKRSGEKAVFDPAKLRHSLERSGASDLVIDQVGEEVEAALYNNITTKEIYKIAFRLLKKHARPTAARYKLKEAIMELGPSGYPFENFVAEILNHQGLRTQTGVRVKGHCLTHEVDVIAEKEDKHFLVECKFHSDSRRHCDVKVPLYIQSRFEDISEHYQRTKGHKNKYHQGWIYTNTRFTHDATRYGRCIGLNLVGWDYPLRGSLKEQIDVAGLHPLTCLTSLRKNEKQSLLSGKNVLCMDLFENPSILSSLSLSNRRQSKIMEEVEDLCNP